MSSVTLAQPDVTLALDADGIIMEATLSNAISGAVSGAGVAAWRGRRWQDTVGDSGGDRVRLIVEDARTSGVSAFCRVLQRFPSGLELPMEYTTVRVDGRTGGLLAIGKNLQAVSELQTRLIATQHAREQEYWKLREVETRYRLLFDASNEAVLLVRVDDFRVVEANPAAVRTLGVAPGWEFVPDMPPHERQIFQSMLAGVRDHGRAPGVLVHLGTAREPWALRASLVASSPGLLYLMHLSQVGGAPTQAAGATASPATATDAVSTEALLERLPDGFVAVDPVGVILRANQAFAELVQMGTAGAVVGERMGRWLSHPGSDMDVLLSMLHRHRVVRLLSTKIHGELGLETEVEISATTNADVRAAYCGLLIRDVGRRLRDGGLGDAGDSDRLKAVLRAATNQIGRTPLLKVVRDTADAVERYYIRSALDLSDGNRTAAAELLGLSRQSLHTKLNRLGFEGAGMAPVDMPD